MSEIVDFTDVLRAAHPAFRVGRSEKWRCAVWLSAFDWQGATPDLAGQSSVCKAYLVRHTNLKREMTFRNRNAERNIEAEFDRLMDAVEDRLVDAVLVPRLSSFGPTYSEASFYVERVLLPAGVRFIDIAGRFDSARGGSARYLKKAYDTFEAHVQRVRELERLSEGRITRTSVPYGYIYDESARGGVRIDEVVANAVRTIFTLAAQDEYTASGLLAQVATLNAPSPRDRKCDLAGREPDEWRRPIPWSMDAVERMVLNPFYAGVFDPMRIASARTVSDPLVAVMSSTENHHEPLVDKGLQLRAIESMEKNKGRQPKRTGTGKGGSHVKKIAEGRWICG